MKILIVGSGGREHALAWKLSQEAEVVAAPGNPGIAECARCVPAPVSDFDAIADLAVKEAVDLVVVGPENPLIDGLADKLRSKGLSVFGPGADGAELEGSKAFSKELMMEAGIPTADFAIFHEPYAAHDYIRKYGGKMAIKASGLALGKGVLITSSEDEAHEAIDAILVEEIFGDAGSSIVVEELLTGPEFSLLTLCSDNDYFSLPVAQDHKRALDGDRGPNTGGMGTYSPVPSISRDLVAETEAKVVVPILRALHQHGISFRGVLFSGLMMHHGEVRCLEFNVRFGDPEIQTLTQRIGKGFAAALKACADGQPISPIEILDRAAVTVCVASGGYPGSYEKGKPITVGAMPPGVTVFHAGTALKDGQLVTSGGRVAAITATAATLAGARELAYSAVQAFDFEGKHFRTDIAAGV